MKVFLALACLLALGSAQHETDPKRIYSNNYGRHVVPPFSTADKEWENYKQTYGKNYGGANTELDNLRRDIYFQAKERIQAHNELYQKGLSSYKQAINQFADLLPVEVSRMLNGYRSNQRHNADLFVPINGSLPDTVDWRTKKVVTPVKDQRSCGSCWAFSVTGSVEGQWALKKGKLVSLSEQQLVDCSGPEGNHGCEGGDTDPTFTYIKDQGGIDTEASYPYQAQDDHCRFKKADATVKVSGYNDIESGSESALQNAAANVGPISVCIDASQSSFHWYNSGIYDEPDCSSDFPDLDHCVLVVGYGTEDGKDYWLVKNSWGESWGDHGYIKMSRNKNNQCGIATEASYPLVP